MILMTLTHVVLCKEGGLSFFVVLELVNARWKVLNIGFCNHCLLQIFTNQKWLNLY